MPSSAKLGREMRDVQFDAPDVREEEIGHETDGKLFFWRLAMPRRRRRRHGRQKERDRKRGGILCARGYYKEFLLSNNNNYINEFVVLRYEYLKSISIVLHALYYIVCGES